MMFILWPLLSGNSDAGTFKHSFITFLVNYRKFCRHKNYKCIFWIIKNNWREFWDRYSLKVRDKHIVPVVQGKPSPPPPPTHRNYKTSSGGSLALIPILWFSVVPLISKSLILQSFQRFFLIYLVNLCTATGIVLTWRSTFYYYQ